MDIVIKFLLDLFFPIYCVNCKKEGEWVCDECVEVYCNTVGYNNIIQKKNMDSLTYIDDIFYFYDFNNAIMSRLIHILKYKYAYDVARFIANIINDKFFDFMHNYENFIIIPIPLNKKRFNERGFNQSEIILEKLKTKNQKQKIEIVNILKRTKNTKHQAGLSKEDRENNLKDAFVFDNKYNIFDFTNSTIVLFDDVVTTGNTIDKCAKVLRESGFYGKIIGLCVAGQN